MKFEELTIPQLLAYLRKEQKWLTENHLWINNAEDDAECFKRLEATSEEFSERLALWDKAEQSLRMNGYGRCVASMSKGCSEDSPVMCDACVLDKGMKNVTANS